MWQCASIVLVQISTKSLLKMKLLTILSLAFLFSSVNVATVSAYNRKILTIEGDFNKPYPGAVGRAVELIYSFDLPHKFDPLVISF